MPTYKGFHVFVIYFSFLSVFIKQGIKAARPDVYIWA